MRRHFLSVSFQIRVQKLLRFFTVWIVPIVDIVNAVYRRAICSGEFCIGKRAVRHADDFLEMDISFQDLLDQQRLVRVVADGNDQVRIQRCKLGHFRAERGGRCRIGKYAYNTKIRFVDVLLNIIHNPRTIVGIFINKRHGFYVFRTEKIEEVKKVAAESRRAGLNAEAVVISVAQKIVACRNRHHERDPRFFRHSGNDLCRTAVIRSRQSDDAAVRQFQRCIRRAA